MSFDRNKKKISILGATGSVGRCAVDVILSDPARFDVICVSAGQNAQELARIAVKLQAKIAVIADDRHYDALKSALEGTGIQAAGGAPAIEDQAARTDVDLVLAAIVGFAGLRPVLRALESGVNVAIANKEPLVAAGILVMEAARKSGAKILPVDSEHNAVFQVFDETQRTHVEKIILTASGGPFLDWDKTSIENASVEQAIKHPNWSMGRKISVDSATMMNKALEVIEAHYLFEMPPEKIDVLVHPQSLIHSMVAYADGSILCQMGASDMRTPVAYALAWPQRMATPGEKLDFTGQKTFDLTFRAPDFEKFPALRYAYDCLKSGTFPCVVLNAANEIAVDAFLGQRIRFGRILDCISFALDKNFEVSCNKSLKTVEEIEEVDIIVRRAVADFINT